MVLPVKSGRQVVPPLRRVEQYAQGDVDIDHPVLQEIGSVPCPVHHLNRDPFFDEAGAGPVLAGAHMLCAAGRKGNVRRVFRHAGSFRKGWQAGSNTGRPVAWGRV